MREGGTAENFKEGDPISKQEFGRTVDLMASREGELYPRQHKIQQFISTSPHSVPDPRVVSANL